MFSVLLRKTVVHLGYSPVQLVLVSCLFIISSFLTRSLAVPNCAEYSTCNSCATQNECAWCASENSCVLYSEAFSKDCRGVVFDAPCPSSYVTGEFVNIVVDQLMLTHTFRKHNCWEFDRSC